MSFRPHAICLALVACLALPAAARADAKAASAALAHGDYGTAESALEGDTSATARLLRVELLHTTGRYDAATQLAEQLVREQPAVASQARLWGARAHHARGRYDEARVLLAPLVKEREPEALDWHARAAEASGDHAAAVRAYRQLIEAYNTGRTKDARSLLAVARAAWQLGAFKDANHAFSKATAADDSDVEVQLAWADLFTSKYAAAEAAACLRHAMDANPHHPQVLERKAHLEYEHRLDFAGADALLDEALTINPQLTAAHVTRAAIALRDHALDDALAHVGRGLAVNPKDLEALSLKAAIHFVADDKRAFERTRRAVLAIDPHFSRMYSIIARYAEWEHRYADLVGLAERALQLDPDDAYAHATRGLNLLRLGREREGLEALHQAWRRDRYNQRVFNTLNLYEDVIEPHYEDYREGRYQVRVHKEERAFLEPYVAPLLARGFDALQAHYGITPKGPLWFELYANPEHFSVRTTGMPRVGVQGVCFGKVVTAISPGATQINWAQILWHEQAHIFHIALSDNRVPRWFTEGLAEYETIIARPEWRREDDGNLLDALEAGTLPKIANLNHAFTHARSPREVMVAYYASSRVVAYLVDHYGFERMPQLLRAWGRGLRTEEVFAEVLGLTLDDLDEAFRAHELERLAPLRAQFRVRLDQYAPLREFQQRAIQKPGPEAEAALAAAQLLAGRPPLAVRHAKKALEGAPHNRLALWVLAQASFRATQLDETRAAVKALLAAGAESYEVRILEARLAIQAKDWKRARACLERAIELSPWEAESYVALGVVADQTRDLKLRADAALGLARLEQHSPGPVLLALPLLSDQKRYAELAELFEHGTNLIPQSSLLHRFGARAQHALGHPEQALTLAERAVTLARSPEEEASGLIEQARALAALGRPEAAKTSADRATQLVPALADAAQRALSR